MVSIRSMRLMGTGPDKGRELEEEKVLAEERSVEDEPEEGETETGGVDSTMEETTGGAEVDTTGGDEATTRDDELTTGGGEDCGGAPEAGGDAAP